MLLLLVLPVAVAAQRTYTLTADELKIDSVLPHFTFHQELGAGYADSVYEVKIEYPEFAPMKRREVRRYRKLTGEKLPEWPAIDSYVGVSRRKGTLYASFVPFLRRDGKNLKMVSFKLTRQSRPQQARRQLLAARGGEYAPSAEEPQQGHDTLPSQGMAAGTALVKISVPSTGFYQLSDSLLRAAGFANPQQVKVYGYGGALQPEQLAREYIEATDGLPQVPTAMIGGRRVFYGVGPVNWLADNAEERTQNPYSTVGCYFLADGGADEPLLLDSAAFVAAVYPSPNDYHAIYEVDNFAWYHGGRNLFDRRLYGQGVTRTYMLPTYGNNAARLGVWMSYNGYCEANITIGDSLAGRIVVDAQTTKGVGRKQYLDTYSKAATDVWYFDISSLDGDSVAVSIQQTSGADMRLDRIECCYTMPKPIDHHLSELAEPAIMGEVTLHNRHADGPADMVIIIPASGKFREQAERLADMHRTHDLLRVNIVTAGELYNEFSSGTPDVNAYRRYLKMLYDRAETEADMPRYLVLFGDAAFDNRMLTSDFSQQRPDDFLLCYESENSLSETSCYVSDDFFAMLDEGEGGDLVKSDKADVAVGRFPCRTDEEARIMVDKAISQRLNEHPGAWQNVVCIMGDDGNANMHMNDAETVASIIEEQWPAYQLRKVYWDAYQRYETATGQSYPDVANAILQQMRDGALLMNYSGHGSPLVLSHERPVVLADFKNNTTQHLPLWFTASCDIAPFDGYQENIGEQAVFNPHGGAFAFIGTARTVYAVHNRSLNKAFTNYLFALSNGRPTPIGEALRLAKNDQVLGVRTQQQAGINKLHYELLGDPALALSLPTMQVFIDSINGRSVANDTIMLAAGDSAVVTGHVGNVNVNVDVNVNGNGNVSEDDNGDVSVDETFNGVATLVVRDAELTITCRMNPQASKEMPKEPLVYKDRPFTLFTGSDSVRNGRFTIAFAMPKDVCYSDLPGQLLVYAYDNSRQHLAHGHSEKFVIASADDYAAAGDGPSVVAWLDAPAFADGGTVSDAPLFHADIADADGINASGAGIGHDLELVIDNMMRYTYNLNSYFSYAFGDYRYGSVDFRLPYLDEGPHSLSFRVWDVLNNSTVATLSFLVGMQHSPLAIAEVQGGDNSRGEQAFDLMGRPAFSTSRSASSLLLIRQHDGKVKKKLHKGNK